MIERERNESIALNVLVSNKYKRAKMRKPLKIIVVFISTNKIAEVEK